MHIKDIDRTLTGLQKLPEIGYQLVLEMKCLKGKLQAHEGKVREMERALREEYNQLLREVKESWTEAEIQAVTKVKTL